jgi:hypothetical protein
MDSDHLNSYTNKHDNLNLVFAYHEEEDKIYPIILTKIADAQRKDHDSYTDKHDDWNLMLADHKEEEEIYPLTLTEIAGAQHKDPELKVYFKKNAKMPQKDTGLHLIKDTKVLCKNGKVIIPPSLRHRAVS